MMGRDLTGAPGSIPLMTFRSGSAVARALGPRSGSRGMSPAAAYLPARVERSGRGGRAEPAAAPQSRTAGSTALPRRRRVACLTESARRVRT